MLRPRSIKKATRSPTAGLCRPPAAWRFKTRPPDGTPRDDGSSAGWTRHRQKIEHLASRRIFPGEPELRSGGPALPLTLFRAPSTPNALEMPPGLCLWGTVCANWLIFLYQCTYGFLKVKGPELKGACTRQNQNLPDSLSSGRRSGKVRDARTGFP